MPLTNEQRVQLERLRRKYRIDFTGHLPNNSWPQCHQVKVSEIRKLAESKYETYANHVNLTDEPWKLDIKISASRLAQAAVGCVRRNESTWRFACEPLVFARLSAEVACRRCRQRVWRSEIEAQRVDGTRKAEALALRQMKREPCRCPRLTRPGDCMETVGLNRIFSHREDESIQHSQEIAQSFPKNADKPDAIYGLRQTRRFENLLYGPARARSGNGEVLVRDLLTEQPIRREGDPLLFPFLVVEAKSGKSADDWHSIKLQSAFSVRMLLMVQHNLQEATGALSKWMGGPFVWMFLSKGEDWRVCGAFMQRDIGRRGTTGSIGYRIVDLWSGSISSKDGALQLLLIVDHIFDWAREIYREDILNELQVLSSGENENASLVFSDSGISSNLQISGENVPAQPTVEANNNYYLPLATFKALDAPYGVVRHAAFIQTSFRCLFVTGDNVDTLLKSTHPQIVRILARQVLIQVASNSIFVDIDSLHAMEKHWTGRTRYPRPLCQSKFYTAITYTAYLTPLWEQVRELHAIAIAEGAFEPVLTAAKFRRGQGNDLKPSSSKTDNCADLVEVIASLRSESSRCTLLAAVKRLALRITLPWPDRREDTVYDDGILRDIVQHIYKSFKRGTLEPQEPFLRVSDCFERQHRSNCEGKTFHAFEGLDVSADGCVLIYARPHKHEVGRSKLSSVCAYFIGGTPIAPSKAFLGTAVKNTFENHDVYHTTGQNGTSNIRYPKRNISEKTPWNLEGSQGVSIEGRRFLIWLKALGVSAPSRQGSPRLSSGAYLHSRNTVPWKDPRYGGDAELVALSRFYAYKVITQEVRYWRSIAQERTAQGRKCCPCCASYEDGTYEECGCKKAFELDKPKWFSNALIGNIPILPVDVNDDVLRTIFRDRYDSLEEGYSGDDEWEKYLNFYSRVNDDFVDIRDLLKQVNRYLEEIRERTSFARRTPNKRKRTPDADQTTSRTP